LFELPSVITAVAWLTHNLRKLWRLLLVSLGLEAFLDLVSDKSEDAEATLHDGAFIVRWELALSSRRDMVFLYHSRTHIDARLWWDLEAINVYKVAC